jgi:hypothetical protein
LPWLAWGWLAGLAPVGVKRFKVGVGLSNVALATSATRWSLETDEFP